jgi:hypothetical protein
MEQQQQQGPPPPTGASHTLDLAEGEQQILEEEIDENYEPTEQGKVVGRQQPGAQPPAARPTF